MLVDFFRSLGRPDVLDLGNQAHYLWALLPEIVLALGAMGVLMVDVFQKGSRSEPSRANSKRRTPTLWPRAFRSLWPGLPSASAKRTALMLSERAALMLRV